MGRPTHAARSRALSAPSTAVACGRPRRGAVAALVPRWSHGDDHLPGGRVTRALPPPAKGHGRGAWCKRRNRTAGGHGGRTYPANQHRVCIHTLSCVRRLTMLVPIGTGFGYGTRTHTLSRTLPGREASRCAVRPQSAAQKRATDATRGRLARSRWPSRPLAEVDSTARGGRFDRSRRSIRPVHRASRPAGSGESESFKGRLDSTRSVEWADGRSTRSPDSTLPLWRVALSRGRLAAASGPPPRASRPLATNVRAATSSAGPSYITLQHGALVFQAGSRTRQTRCPTARCGLPC